MRIFVAGATGAIGRPLVRRLVAAGHEVTGMTRTQARAAELRAAGAAAVVCDAFDVEAVRAAVRDSRAQVVIHQLTALPDRFDFRTRHFYAATNRLRGEGTRILLDAARDAVARRFVCQSVAFVYEPTGGPVKAEDAPLIRRAPGIFREAVRTITEMEGMVLEADGLDGLVLRYGFFYGPGTYLAADGVMTRYVRRRWIPVVGPGSGVLSFVHVDDAAEATALTVERGAPGVYNVVDDEPAPMREWLPAFAEAAGAKRPLSVPVWPLRLVGGREVVTLVLGLRGASNAKARCQLGWRPTRSSWRQGFAESLRPRAPQRDSV